MQAPNNVCEFQSLRKSLLQLQGENSHLVGEIDLSLLIEQLWLEISNFENTYRNQYKQKRKHHSLNSDLFSWWHGHWTTTCVCGFSEYCENCYPPNFKKHREDCSHNPLAKWDSICDS